MNASLEGDARLVAGYTTLFDANVRTAQRALLDWARHNPDGDGWPTAADVVRFARFYKVKSATLGGLVGLLPYRVGRSTGWADMARMPKGQVYVDEEMFSHQTLVAYGFFNAANAVVRGEQTIH